MKKPMNPADNAGFNQETWLTPPHILAALGGFDLDPCAAPSPRPWPTAERHIELPEDGLRAEWLGRVWLNPPYGAQAAYWLDKLATHGDGIALVFARTETVMFQDHVWPKADAVLFLRGRITFCDRRGKPADYNSGAPPVLIAYGQRNVDALEASGLDGFVLRIPKHHRPAGAQPSLALA